MLTQHLAGNLRRLRRARDFSQAQLARLANCRQQDISAYERGLRPNKLAQIDRLARALAVDATQLLGLTPVPRDDDAGG